MHILLVELNPNEISVDESLFPDQQKDSFIYEHLRHYCSKFYPLPTITVRVCAEAVFVIRGHQYLAIARELGQERIRAVVDQSSSKQYVHSFLDKPSVVQLNWEIARQEGYDTFVEFVWYVFFFERPLNQEEREIFEEQIVEFFRTIKLPEWAEVPENRIIDLSYPYSGYCAEFQAYVPIEDERWYSQSKAVVVNFHLKHIPILSFQGRKFHLE
jgi:hypothetical protein